MEANQQLAEVITKAQTTREFQDPTDKEIDSHLDETRRDVDGVTMSWEETRSRYQQIPNCSLRIVWAYWITVMTPLQQPKGEDFPDWCLAEGVSVQELPNEPSDSPWADLAQSSVVLRERADLDSPRLSRSARSTRSETCSQHSERSASHEPRSSTQEGLADRPPKDKGTRT